MNFEITLLITGTLVLFFSLLRLKPRFLSREAYIAEMSDLLEDARIRGDHQKALKLSRAIEQAR